MATQASLAAQLNALAAQIGKIQTETSGLFGGTVAASPVSSDPEGLFFKQTIPNGETCQITDVPNGCDVVLLAGGSFVIVVSSNASAGAKSFGYRRSSGVVGRKSFTVT